MSLQIALLRAVNVGGTGRLAMGELRAFMEGLGFTGVRTLLQTGNLVFDSPRQGGAALEAVLEAQARKTLGLDTVFFVRSPGEWAAAIEANPYPDVAEADPAKLVLMPLKRAPDGDAVAALRGAIAGPERVAAGERHIYIHFPDGQGRSKLPGGLIERRLGSQGTARNWNTVLKLAAMTQG